MAPEYPHLTPYQFASNRPIDGVDLDGLEYMDADVLLSSTRLITRGQHISSVGILMNIRDNMTTAESVTYEGNTYYWIGFDISDTDGTLLTTWMNESLSKAEQSSITDFYNNYDGTERRRLNECHDAGCCIDCFNGAVNELHGISESDLTSTSESHPQRIDYTLGKLEGSGLAESIGSFTPSKNENGEATGFNNLENTILNSLDNIKGVYLFGVSLGNGYHSTALRVDYTDINNPVYQFLDQSGIVEYTDFNDLVNAKYLRYTNGAINSYGEGNFNVNLNISKIDSDDNP